MVDRFLIYVTFEFKDKGAKKLKLNKGQIIITGMVLFLILAFAATGFVGAASRPASTVGYVDNDKIATQLPDYKSFQNDVKAKQSQLSQYENTLLQQHNTYLKDLANKATQEKTGKSPEEQTAIDKKYREIAQKKTDEIKGKLDQKRNEMMKALNDQKKVIDARVTKSIASIAAQRNLTMVLDKKAIYYGGTDITDAVIENMKKATKTKK